MGTPGVPFAATKDQIIFAIKQKKGKLTLSAKLLNCDYVTIKRKIDADEELIKLVNDERHGFSESLLDKAEDLIDYAVDLRDKDLKNALTAAFYLLNNKGEERGYSPNPNKKTTGTIDEARSAVQAINSDAGDKAPCGSQMEDESPLLHQGCPRKKNTVQAELGTEDPLAGFPPV